VAPSRVRPGLRRTHRHDASTHQHGRCGSFGATAPPRSGQRSRQARSEGRHAARVASQRDALTGETAAAPAGERSVSRPRFPIGLRGATAAYVANANGNTTMRRVPLAATSWLPGT
jgi:hypothetical protein